MKAISEKNSKKNLYQNANSKVKLFRFISLFSKKPSNIVYHVITAFFMTLYLSSCQSPEHNHGHDHDKADGKESHVHDKSESTNQSELTLNNGQKWKADESTNSNVAELKKIVSEKTPATLEEYHAAGNKIQEAANKLIKDCRMKGPDHEALHHWLEPLLESNKALLKSNDLAAANEYYSKVKNQINIYSTFFE